MALPAFINGHVASPQEVHEFVRAKKARGELVSFDVKRGARATAQIIDRFQFAALRQGLRENPSYARASERLDSIEHELFRLRGVRMPLPERLEQESDGTIGLCWPGLTVAADRDNLLAVIPGSPPIGVSSRLVDLIAARAVVGESA